MENKSYVRESEFVNMVMPNWHYETPPDNIELFFCYKNKGTYGVTTGKVVRENTSMYSFFTIISLQDWKGAGLYTRCVEIGRWAKTREISDLVAWAYPFMCMKPDVETIAAYNYIDEDILSEY